MSMTRELKFRRTATYEDELANIREVNRELADQIEEKREYFEHCLTTSPYRPSPGLRVEALEGKITRPEWLRSYPKIYSFRINKQARVIFWWTDDGTCEYLFPFAKHYTRS
jgi:plasmid maintenance system killer protein